MRWAGRLAKLLNYCTRSFEANINMHRCTQTHLDSVWWPHSSLRSWHGLPLTLSKFDSIFQSFWSTSIIFFIFHVSFWFGKAVPSRDPQHWSAILSAHVQLHHPDCYPSAQKCSWWAVPRPSVTLGNFQTLDHRKVAKQFRLKNLEQNPILHDASWCFMMLDARKNLVVPGRAGREIGVVAAADHQALLRMVLPSAMPPLQVKCTSGSHTRPRTHFITGAKK